MNSHCDVYVVMVLIVKVLVVKVLVVKVLVVMVLKVETIILTSMSLPWEGARYRGRCQPGSVCLVDA